MIPDGIEPLVEWLADEYDDASISVDNARATCRRDWERGEKERAEFRAALLTLVARASKAAQQ